MAETLLIVFIVFILLGMPISIAMGVGALGAAMLLSGAQSDHHPDPLRRPAVGLLPAAVGAAVHPGRQHRRARRRGARASSTSPPRWSAASAAASPTSTCVDSMFFGGISGSAVADVSALGTFLIPQMVRKGYDLDFATALTVSHRRRGADHPALDHRRHLRLDGGRIGGGHVRGRHHPGPAGRRSAWRCRCSSSPASATIPRSRRRRCREFMAVLRNALPALMIPVIIMGGILFGLFTPTEAAAVAVVYALVVPPIFYREPALRELPKIFADSRAAVRRDRPHHRLRRRLRLGAHLLEVPVQGGRGHRGDRAGLVAVHHPDHRALPDPRHVPDALGDHPGHRAGAAAGGAGGRRPSRSTSAWSASSPRRSATSRRRWGCACSSAWRSAACPWTSW